MRINLNKVTLWVSAAFLPIVTLSSAMAYQPRSIATQAPSLVATKVISAAQQKAALAYWNRERVAATKPMRMPVQTGKATIDAPAMDRPQVVGPAQSVPAGFASRNADRIARAAYPKDWAAGQTAAEEPAADSAAADTPTGTGSVYSSYIVNRTTTTQSMYPHRWVGRVSFTTPGGTSYCSATSISNNVMLTAAHCLYDSTGNQWYSNWVFSPGYRVGSAPFGSFAATQCWVLTNWINLSGSYSINGWAQHDVGVCKMGNNSSGSTLNNAVGWMGRQWNYPYVRHFHNVGYPFRDYTDAFLDGAGAYLRTCVAESFQQTTETRGMGCNHGRGISGGPWIIGYAPQSVTGAADGVNSGLYIGTQNIYGARFNSNNIVPLCNAAVC